MARQRLSINDLDYAAHSKVVRAHTTQGEHSRMIWDGYTFEAHYEDANVPNEANLDFLLITPADPKVHLQGVEVSIAAGPDKVYIYEDCTVSANGTALTSNNRNRNSTNTAGMLVYRDPTVTGTGTEISKHSLFAAANKVPINHVGDVGEWILKPSAQYLIRVLNDSGGVGDIELHISWHEPGYVLVDNGQ